MSCGIDVAISMSQCRRPVVPVSHSPTHLSVSFQLRLSQQQCCVCVVCQHLLCCQSSYFAFLLSRSSWQPFIRFISWASRKQLPLIGLWVWVLSVDQSERKASGRVQEKSFCFFTEDTRQGVKPRDRHHYCSVDCGSRWCHMKAGVDDV